MTAPRALLSVVARLTLAGATPAQTPSETEGGTFAAWIHQHASHQ